MKDFIQFVEENFPVGIDQKSWGAEKNITCAFCKKICWKGDRHHGEEVKCCEDRQQAVIQQRIYRENARNYQKGEKEKAYYERVKRSGIDGRYIDLSFKKFETKKDPILENALSRCEDFLDNGKMNLILMGGVGVGKTHLAISALKKHMWAKSEDARIIWQSSEIRDGDYRCALLCIDDIGREAGSEKFLDFRRGLLRQIVDVRNRNFLKTIYTTNATKREIMGMFGEHTIDRMFENSETIVISVPSRRTNN